MKSYKFRLKLNRKQEHLAWNYIHIARKYWNVLVDIDNRNNKGEFDNVLSKRGNKMYHSEFHDRGIYSLNASDYHYLAKMLIGRDYETDNEKWSWYYQPNQTFIYRSIAREIVKVRYLNKGKLRFRSENKHSSSFYVRCDMFKQRPSRIYLKGAKKLQIPSLGVVSINSINPNIDLNRKKHEAKVIYDGKYWYLSYSYRDEQVAKSTEYTNGVGIDLGIKTLATISDGTTIPNINTFRRVRILNKRLKRLQRKVSRKYHINKCNKHNKTKNIIKLEHQIRLIYRSIKNIRINHIREFIAKLVKKQPTYVALEDLNVKGMMKNKHLAKHITNCSFYTIREHLIRKAKERQIVVRLVDRFYPSSKTCSNCGYYKKDLKLSERVFHCPDCGKTLDRDLNASLNLAQTDRYQLV